MRNDRLDSLVGESMLIVDRWDSHVGEGMQKVEKELQSSAEFAILRPFLNAKECTVNHNQAVVIVWLFLHSSAVTWAKSQFYRAE